MDGRRKLEQRLEQKIEQKKREKQSKANCQPDQSLSSSQASRVKNHVSEWVKGLELEAEDDNQFSINNDKFAELEALGNEDQKELEEIKNKIHQLEKEIDHHKYKLLQVSKQAQMLQFEKQEKQQKFHKDSQEVSKAYRQELQTMKVQFEARIDKYLEQIDALLREKSEFNQQCQIFIQEDAKMNKTIKDLEERYKKDIKNAREAFLVLEKEKRDRWEQSKIATMKDEAINKLEPKLKAIINDSNDEIKKAGVQWQQKHSEFTKEYTAQMNKKLQQLKQDSFAQSQKEKEELRAEERRKLKQSYEKLQMEFEEDRAKLRRMYKEQILQLEKRRRQEVEEFLNNNKITQEEHLVSIRKMREDYQNKMKVMKENVRQRVSQEITKVQKIYKKKLEEAQAQILTDNEQKFTKAKQKIDQAMALREKQAKERLKKERANLERDIQAKYEKKFVKSSKQVEQEKQKLRQKLKQTEERMIGLELAYKKQNNDITAYSKDCLKAQQRNEELSAKIKEKENEIIRIRQAIAESNMQYEDEIKNMERDRRKQYERVDKQIGKKREEKQRVEQEWLERYSQLDDDNLNKLQLLKSQKNEQIKKETETCRQLSKDLDEVKDENKKLADQLQVNRRKIKMVK